jgi:soluble lytic murein transglycosylase
MRAWIVAAAAAGLLTGAAAPSGPFRVQEQSAVQATELEQLRVQLAERELLLKATQARLQQYEDDVHYQEALRLGVVEAVKASELTARQQRRLAVAIVREAQRNGVDPLLVIALIRCESSFNAYAVSGVGAMGLMQVMPDTGSYLADKAGYQLGRPKNLFDAETNIELGTAYLADLIERFGSVDHALVAYNAGPATARKILSQREMRKKFMSGYPAKVVREFRKLKELQERELSLRAQQEAKSTPG